MSHDHQSRDDEIMKLLGRLAAPNREIGDDRRVRRTRARCHEELRRRSRRASLGPSALDAGLGLLGLAYLAQITRLAVLLLRAG